MTPQEAVLAEYNRTILDLQGRLAQAVQFAAEQLAKLEDLEKRLKEKKAEDVNPD